MRMARLVLLAAVIGVLGALSTACGDDDANSSTKLKADLSEWTITLNKTEVPAGKVMITAKNNSKTEKHELVVVKSDVAPDKLPVIDGKVPEDSLDAVGEIAEFDAGKTESKQFDLAAGRYVLMCNLPRHYEQGMHAQLVVK